MRDPATLARLLPLLEAPGFTAERHVPPTQDAAGIWSFPLVEHAGVVGALVAAAHADGWVLTDFDWPGWHGTAEAQALRNDPSRATPRQLAQLLTVVIRQDRFVEGALLDAFESGLMLRILRRAAALAQAT